MTKRKFIQLGLFVLALGPLIMALQTSLLIQHKIKPDLLTTLFIFPGIPVIFGSLLWKRLRYIGKPKVVIALHITTYIALLFACVELGSYLFMGISAYFPSDLIDEIAAWSKAGGHGELRFSIQATFKIMAFNTAVSALWSWPYILVLLVGAQDPRTPSRLSVVGQFAKRLKDKFNSVANTAKQKLA